jgi:branched-chain amino acid transport system substrate-binding protein
VNKVSALLGGADPALAAALPDVAQRYQVPLIIAGGRPEEIPSDYVFHTGIRPAERAQSLAKFAKEELKAKTVGILTDGNGNSSSGILVGAFSKEFKKSFSMAGKWVYTETRKGAAIAERESDFKSPEDLKGIVNQIRDKHYDVIVFDGAPADLITLRKAGLNEKTPVLFAGEEGSQKSLQAVPSAQVIYLATAFAPEAPDEAVKKFVQKFQERFQEVPDVHAALAYDNARLLFQGLANVKQLEGSKIKEALDKEETFEGVTGPLNFNVKDRWFSRPVIILRVENGKVEYVKKY